MNAATPLESIPNVDVVHESEVQRQHVRVRLPASIRFKVDGTEHRYRLHDVSAGGFSFTSTKERYETGQLFRGSLVLAGDTVGFSLPVSFDINSAAANGRVSCRFQDMRGLSDRVRKEWSRRG